VDISLCEAAVSYADIEKEELEQLVADITNGEANACISLSFCRLHYRF